MTQPDHRIPAPLERALEEIEWVRANLRPGEKLEDFFPPAAPAPARRLPERPLFGDRRVKRWPLWAEALAFLVVMVALPSLMSLAVAAGALVLPFWCIWRGWQLRKQPKPTPWAPPRYIPPYRKPMSLAEKAARFSP